jgi:hypothetical protein
LSVIGLAFAGLFAGGVGGLIIEAVIGAITLPPIYTRYVKR